MTFPRIALFFAATLALGACATPPGDGAIVNVTPAVFGQASPAIPADWRNLSGATHERGIAFGCGPQECANPGIIAYQALRVTPEVEPADGKFPVTQAVLAKVRGEIESYGGTVSNVSTRKLTKSGDAVEQTMTISHERKAYAVVRVTRLPNEVHTIFAAGPTREQARRNMTTALAGLK